MHKVSKISVLGAGSWGTAVALLLARQGHLVTLWSKNISYLDCENKKYLPGINFPNNLLVTDNLKHALDTDYLLIAVPSHAFLDLIAQIPNVPKHGIAWLTKGIEPISYRLFSNILLEKYGPIPLAMISGPSFAKEVAMQKPTAMLVASNNELLQKKWQALMHSQYNRIYLSNDLIGVQICGAIKNVLAIACGISDGLSYGANARAALITRGLNEMVTLGKSLGATEQTFYGLAGVGDLVLTCTDNQSRNRRFGLYIGQGDSITSATDKVAQVVEGLHNAKQTATLAQQNQVEMPICTAVYSVISGVQTAAQAAASLMARDLNY